MKFVNINDIEDLVLAKHDINLMLIEDNIVEDKLSINDFLDIYAMPNYVYVVNGINIPFKLLNIRDMHYVFVTNYNKEELELLENKIRLLKYDMNNLIKLNFNDMINMTDPTNDNFVIINGQYYK